MTLPAYNPLSRDPIPFDALYDDYVAHYGPPPEGYRWLKRGEIVPDGSIVANARLNQWEPSPLVCWGVVERMFYAIATPIVAPETNNTSATLTVRQCAEMFNEWARVAEGLERPAAYAECAQLLKNSCRDYV